jgi:hypothetical protein
MSDPALIKQIQDAVERGLTVIIPAPSRPTPPPHDKDAAFVAALCRLLGLNHREGRILAQLLVYGCCSAEELRTAACNYQPITLGSFRVYLSMLRKKLKARGMQIGHVRNLGYGLEGNARTRIRKQLAESSQDAEWAARLD